MAGCSVSSKRWARAERTTVYVLPGGEEEEEEEAAAVAAAEGMSSIEGLMRAPAPGSMNSLLLARKTRSSAVFAHSVHGGVNAVTFRSTPVVIFVTFAVQFSFTSIAPVTNVQFINTVAGALGRGTNGTKAGWSGVRRLDPT